MFRSTCARSRFPESEKGAERFLAVEKAAARSLASGHSPR
jgi:hypothetical protein